MRKLAVVFALASLASAEDAALRYPATRKGDVVDDYHGGKVADPYRWLEDLNAPDTRRPGSRPRTR